MILKHHHLTFELQDKKKVQESTNTRKVDPLKDDAPTRMGKNIVNAKKLGAVTDAQPDQLTSGCPKKNKEYVKAVHDATMGNNDDYLKKWMNKKLKQAGQKEINNFGDDLKNGNALTHLLNHIKQKVAS